ncbi:MAG: TolC family protein [Myxococcota bacterium]
MVLLWSIGVGRAEPTLAEYMEAAVAHHPQMAVAQAGSDAARADTLQAGAGLLPTVRGNASWAYNQNDATVTLPDPAGGPPTEIVLAPHQQLDASLNLRVPLVDGPAWARWREASLASDAASADAAAAAQDLRLEVARAWYAAVAAQQVVVAAERAQRSAEENLRYLSLRAEAGAATSLSVQRAQLEVENAALLVIDSRRTWQTGCRRLATLSGLPEPAALPTESPPLELELLPEAELLDAADRDRPELAAARARTAELRASTVGAALSYAPSVAATASEQLTNAPGFADAEASYRVGVEVDWLLLDVGARAAEVRRARAELAAAEAREREVRDTVRDEVHAAWLAAEAARSRVVAATRGAVVGRAAADETQARFQAGTTTWGEVIQAERDALNAEVVRIRSDGELALARLALLRAAGAPISAP